MPEVRTAARLVLLDADRRILLFRHADGYGREFWATPGGGLEVGETAAQAARHEAAEELGATDAGLVELWTRHSEFDFADRRVWQTETFFLVKASAEILGPEVRERHRLERIIEVRWCPLDEVDTTQEMVFRSISWLALKSMRRAPVDETPTSSWPTCATPRSARWAGSRWLITMLKGTAKHGQSCTYVTSILNGSSDHPSSRKSFSPKCGRSLSRFYRART